MKKFFILIGMSVSVLSVGLSADALKNSLTNIMQTDDSPQMVDLGNINLNAKPKPPKKVHKDRPAKTVIATVNGHKIIKKDADGYLNQRTGGKVTNFDSLPVNQRKMLLQELSLPILALDAAKNELTELEKQTVLTRVWMQKEATKLQIRDEEVHVLYDQLKQQSVDNNDTRTLPEFEAIKDRLRTQMIEKSIMTDLMKDVKIEVAE